MTDEVWLLFKHDELLGRLMLQELNMPYFHCAFTAEPAFARFEALFQAEAIALDAGDDDAQERLGTESDNLMLKLIAQPSGAVIDRFLIHISEGAAWFRY